MQCEVIANRNTLGEFRVEAIDHANEGECYVAIFSGPDAARRATEYAAWANSRLISAPYCEACECFHPEGKHGEWIDRKDPRHSEYPNGKEDEFVEKK